MHYITDIDVDGPCRATLVGTANHDLTCRLKGLLQALKCTSEIEP